MLINTPISFLIATVIIALVVTFVYILLSKFGVWERLQVHADAFVNTIFPKYNGDILNRLFSCVFCTTWWMSLALCIILALAFHSGMYLLIPICSVPISRFLI